MCMCHTHMRMLPAFHAFRKFPACTCIICTCMYHVADVDAWATVQPCLNAPVSGVKVCDRTVPVLLTFASLLQLQIINLGMPRAPLKEYPNCKQRNPVRCNKCKYCNADMKKKQGCPAGTTRSAGYWVGANGGRPCKTAKDTLSCVVPEQSGKPTTETCNQTKGKPSGSKGVGVYRTRGRPMGSTEPSR